jgi:hypothetical protein
MTKINLMTEPQPMTERLTQNVGTSEGLQFSLDDYPEKHASTHEKILFLPRIWEDIMVPV